jgi:hypothetical protein
MCVHYIFTVYSTIVTLQYAFVHKHNLERLCQESLGLVGIQLPEKYKENFNGN